MAWKPDTAEEIAEREAERPAWLALEAESTAWRAEH
jgi:hypothetical protein